MLASGSVVAFTGAALVLLLIPGPGVLYVVARSLSQGTRAGLVSAAGLSAGVLVHVAAAVAGLSTLLLTSAWAFGIVKLCGAGYLIYLGMRTLLRADPRGGEILVPAPSSRRLFRDGVLVSVLNPKLAIFFLAFLPQFADPSRGSVPLQCLLLGLLYAALALVTDGGYVLLAARARGWFGPRFARHAFSRYASGTAYIGLGVGTALVDSP